MDLVSMVASGTNPPWTPREDCLFMYTHIRSACHEEHCPGDVSRYAASEDFSSLKFGICCIKLPCLGNTESTLACCLRAPRQSKKY